MKEIKTLMEHIEDELRDAETYAKLALEYKESDTETASVFFRLSGEEMSHMDMLHKRVAACIERHKQAKGAPPAEMMAVYDYLHKRNIEWAEKVGRLQGMYRT